MFIACLTLVIGIRIALADRFAPNNKLIFDAKLEFKGLPQGLMVVRETDKVKVEATGSTDDLNKLDQSTVILSVDLSKAKQGIADFLVQSPMRPRITIEPKFPRIRLNIENVGTMEQIVELEPLGLPTSDLVFEGASIAPEKVTIYGAESFLAKVRRARVLLYLSQVKAGTSMTMPIEILDESNRSIPYVFSEPSEVTVNPSVTAAPAIKRVLISPNWKGQPAFGFKVDSYEIRPPQLSVRGESAAMSRLATLETEPISIEGLNADVTVSAKLKFPDGIKPAG